MGRSAVCRWCLILAGAVLAGLGAMPAMALDINSAGSGNWTSTTTWSSGTIPASSDNVTIGAHTITISDKVVHEVANLTIQNGGTLTHQANATSELYKVVLNVGANLTIDEGGVIDVTGKGYGTGYGPGYGLGGSYGGSSMIDGRAGPTYGSITAPTNLGSASAASAGGGACLLTVAGTTTVNGAISAGGGGTVYGGAGGSVFLITGTLTGNGTIRANGASGANYDGGGGRIAIILTNSTDFGSVKFLAYGGSSSAARAAAGTVYLQNTNHASNQGMLIVNNNNIAPADRVRCVTIQNSLAASTQIFSEIILTNAGVFGLDTNDTLDISGTVISGGSANRYEGIYVAGGTLIVPSAFAFSNYFIGIGHTNSSFNPGPSLTVGTNATLKLDVPWTANYPITLEAGGWLSHSANTNNEAYKINLAVNGNLEIKPGGQINVDNMGYGPQKGPGGGLGGSYGGSGIMTVRYTNGVTYGSITAPTNLGSGSGGG